MAPYEYSLYSLVAFDLIDGDDDESGKTISYYPATGITSNSNSVKRNVIYSIVELVCYY